VRETRIGDRYLLCSDGLSGVVSEETLRETLLGEADTDVVVEQLVELALKGGGPDNITAIVADVVEVETKPPSAVPVTVGAAAEGVVQRTHGDTPAGKAAKLRPPPEEPEEEDDLDEHHTSGRARRIALGLLLLVLVAGAATGAYLWSQTQYYVGANGSNVAIYQGLSQDVGPLSTSKLYHAEDIPLADLPAYQRTLVRDEIATDGLADAKRIVRQLGKQAQECRDAAAAPAPSPSPTPTESPSPSESGSPSASPSTSPSPSPSATGLEAADCGDGT
jgi:protein phosphatase